MDPISALGAVSTALSLLDATRSALNKPARSRTKRNGEWEEVLKEFGAVASLIENIVSFDKDYRDRTIAHKSDELNAMIRAFMPTLRDAAPYAATLHHAPTPAVTSSLHQAIASFHEKLNLWVQEVM